MAVCRRRPHRAWVRGQTSLAALHETVGITGPAGSPTVGVFWQRPRPPMRG